VILILASLLSAFAPADPEPGLKPKLVLPALFHGLKPVASTVAVLRTAGARRRRYAGLVVEGTALTAGLAVQAMAPAAGLAVQAMAPAARVILILCIGFECGRSSGSGTGAEAQAIFVGPFPRAEARGFYRRRATHGTGRGATPTSANVGQMWGTRRDTA
jgi:hypothetical protein